MICLANLYVMQFLLNTTHKKEEKKKKKILKKLIKRILKQAVKKEVKTLSIPAISTGIYGFPKDECAKIFFDVVLKYFEEHEDTTITEVRFINFDDTTVSFFKKRI